MCLYKTCQIGAALLLGVIFFSIIGCGSDSTSPEPEPGTIILDPNPDSIDAPWILTSQGVFNFPGNGDHAETDLLPGDYTVEWGTVPGWTSPANETSALASGGSLVFEGTYSLSGFAQIPDGTFWMGAQEGELGAGDNEYPRHQVTLTHDFYLQVTEVTNQQYMEMAQWAYGHGYVTATSSSLKDNLGSTQELLDMDGSDCEISFSSGVFTVDSGKEDHPVKEVTWYGSVAYCDWLSLQAGLPRAYDHTTWQCNGNNPYTAAGYRLPTEAEWEYACRAGTQTPFNTGDCLDAGTEANYNGNSPYTGCPSGPHEGWTVPVGSYPANANGLYDMHGNLWEWCNDWYSSSYYSDPGADYDPVGGPPGSGRVLRGGGWGNYAQYCRSANRNWCDPGGSSSGIGFRPARSVF